MDLAMCMWLSGLGGSGRTLYSEGSLTPQCAFGAVDRSEGISCASGALLVSGSVHTAQ